MPFGRFNGSYRYQTPKKGPDGLFYVQYPLPMPENKDLDQMLDEYWKELMVSPLADKSIEDYYYFALCFVRWSKGEFEPGLRVFERSAAR